MRTGQLCGWENFGGIKHTKFTRAGILNVGSIADLALPFGQRGIVGGRILSELPRQITRLPRSGGKQVLMKSQPKEGANGPES